VGRNQRLAKVLQLVRQLKKLERQTRDGRESIAEKLVRWQHLKAPNLPLTLREHDLKWPLLFAEEKQRLETEQLELGLVRIEHIGSTAIPPLAAKNIIDLAVVVKAALPLSDKQIFALERLGYCDYGNSPGGPDVFWQWRLTPTVAFAAHFCYLEDPWWEGAVAFRDYLRAHPEELMRYEARKRDLVSGAGQDFLRYSIGKIELVIELTQKARVWREGAEEADALSTNRLNRFDHE
jgi:GrpB-like predicted nucleotidyltransferase (UPF0157 family)